MHTICGSQGRPLSLFVSDDYTQQIQALKDLGVSIEIDDFGTGHASIAGVLALKPDRLKIDRMFVSQIDQSTARRELMRGLIEMSVSAGAEVVVEGVETMSEAAVVSGLGANSLQGYAFGRPMPLEDFVAWALEWQEGEWRSKTG